MPSANSPFQGNILGFGHWLKCDWRGEVEVDFTHHSLRSIILGQASRKVWYAYDS